MLDKLSDSQGMEKIAKHNRRNSRSFIGRSYRSTLSVALLAGLALGTSLAPSQAQTTSNDTNIIMSNGKAVYSPNVLKPRYNSPASCNITITNTTADPQQLLYGTPGAWKATNVVIPPGGQGGWGVGTPMTAYLSLMSNRNAVLRIVCR
jgi:hypothetical protein